MTSIRKRHRPVASAQIRLELIIFPRTDGPIYFGSSAVLDFLEMSFGNVAEEAKTDEFPSPFCRAGLALLVLVVL